MSSEREMFKTEEERIRWFLETYKVTVVENYGLSDSARAYFLASAPTIPTVIKEFRRFVVEKYGGNFFIKPPDMYWEYEWFKKMFYSQNETEKAVLKKRILSNEPFVKDKTESV